MIGLAVGAGEEAAEVVERIQVFVSLRALMELSAYLLLLLLAMALCWWAHRRRWLLRVHIMSDRYLWSRWWNREPLDIASRRYDGAAQRLLKLYALDRGACSALSEHLRALEQSSQSVAAVYAPICRAFELCIYGPLGHAGVGVGALHAAYVELYERAGLLESAEILTFHPA